MRVNSGDPSDSPSFGNADDADTAGRSSVGRAGPSPSPTPGGSAAQLLDASLGAVAPHLSRALKQAASRSSIRSPGTTARPPLTMGKQIEGVAHGAAQATGKLASGVWDMAKGAAALSPLSYAAEKLSDGTGLNVYHGFSSTAASAKQAVRTIAIDPGGVLKAAVEPYRNAWQAGRYGEAIGMGTVDAVSLFADGVGEAGKLGEAASAAEKVAEGASAAAKVDRVVTAGTAEAGKAGELAKTGTPVATGATDVARSNDAAHTGEAAHITQTAHPTHTAHTAQTSETLTPGSHAAQAPGAKAAAASRPANTTRHGVPRTNAADWRSLRDHWDQCGYGEILSDTNRSAIARGRTPKVDDAWVSYFPEDAGLMGERISMHHIGGSPVTVPLPATRHLDAHMPGGFRYNEGGPGSALPFYPPKPSRE